MTASKMSNKRDSSYGKWAKMEPLLLVKIFTLLNAMDLISGASMVCRSWLTACRDPSLWGTIDLSVLTCRHFDTPKLPSSWSDDDSQGRLLNVLKAFSWISGNNPSTLYFNFYICLKDEHLAFVSERFPNLKRVVLSPFNDLSLNGFSNAVRRWRNLESLTLPSICSPDCVMRVIGENCENFSRLRFTCPFTLEMAKAIGTYLPNLKWLSLRGSLVDTEAVTILLNGDIELEVLNLSHCMFKDILRSSFERTFIDSELQASMIRKGTKIQTFLLCNSIMVCRLCQKLLYESELEFIEQIWREDEVTDLAI